MVTGVLLAGHTVQRTSEVRCTGRVFGFQSANPHYALGGSEDRNALILTQGKKVFVATI